MSESQMEVSNKITNGIYRISKKRKGRSSMWNILAEIVKKDGTKLVGLVYCRVCCKVLKYTPTQTSNLIRHKCCQSVKIGSSLKKVISGDKSGASDIFTSWVVEDCRPFSVVTGTGFAKVAKFLIKIGAKYGEHIDVNDLIPDATKISHDVHKLAADCKDKIREEISEVVNGGSATVSVDLWTDNYVKRNFVGVTLHYRKDSELLYIILGIKSMDFKNSTADKIRKKLENLLSEFGVSNFEHIIYITDMGRNIGKALDDNIRLNCSSHLFSDILDKSFEETIELSDLLISCKNIVKYFKNANLQHIFSTSFESSSSTRWNSNYIMFKSIVENWLIINEVLTEKGACQQLVVINISTLETLVELCNDFEIIFEKLQACSSPSLCFVIPSINKIRTLCEPDNSNAEPIAALKRNILNKLDCTWESNLSLWHKAALFLYPPAAHMQKESLLEIKNFCVSQINNSPQLMSSTSIPPTSPTPTEESISDPLAHKKDIHFFLPDLWEQSFPKIETPQEEVERYSKQVVKITDDFDVISWWIVNKKDYPYLSEIALKIHSIPASSAAAERYFSLAGNVVTEKRNRLGPKSLDSLLFLHSYYKNFDN